MGAIEIVNLVFGYPGRLPILNDLTWNAHLEDGQVLAVLGASGSGKSTLLRLLAGLEHPQSGSIFVNGIDVTKLPPHQRRFSMVFQERSLFPGSVTSNLNFAMKFSCVTKINRAGRVNDLLDLVGLAGLGEKSIETLSGGQRQRVELARALVATPQLCLLDEPMGQLDLPLRRALAKDIRQWISDVSVRAIHVTHDPVEASIIADYLITIDNGKLTQPRRPDVVYSSPENLSEALLTGELNQVQASVVALTDTKLHARFGNGQTVELSGINPVSLSGNTIIVAFRPLPLDECICSIGNRETSLLMDVTSGRVSFREGVSVIELNDDKFHTRVLLNSDLRKETLIEGSQLHLGIPTDVLMVFQANGSRMSFGSIRLIASDQ